MGYGTQGGEKEKGGPTTKGLEFGNYFSKSRSNLPSEDYQMDTNKGLSCIHG